LYDALLSTFIIVFYAWYCELRAECALSRSVQHYAATTHGLIVARFLKGENARVCDRESE